MGDKDDEASPGGTDPGDGVERRGIGVYSNVGVNVAWVAPVGEISPSPRPGDPLITLVGVLGAPSKPRLSTDEVDGGQVDAVDIGANGVTTAASGRGN